MLSARILASVVLLGGHSLSGMVWWAWNKLLERHKHASVPRMSSVDPIAECVFFHCFVVSRNATRRCFCACSRAWVAFVWRKLQSMLVDDVDVDFVIFMVWSIVVVVVVIALVDAGGPHGVCKRGAGGRSTAHMCHTTAIQHTKRTHANSNSTRIEQRRRVLARKHSHATRLELVCCTKQRGVRSCRRCLCAHAKPKQFTAVVQRRTTYQRAMAARVCCCCCSQFALHARTSTPSWSCLSLS